MRDMGEALARRTCSHVIESAGGPDSKYVRGLEEAGLFKCNSDLNNRVIVWYRYRLTYYDDGPDIRVVVDRTGGDIPQDFANKFNKLKVPSNYREVISRVESHLEGKELTLRVRFVSRSNTAGRTQNEDKLFYAIHNCISKPVFSAILGAGNQ